jgi:hypothetical protein
LSDFKNGAALSASANVDDDIIDDYDAIEGDPPPPRLELAR